MEREGGGERDGGGEGEEEPRDPLIPEPAGRRSCGNLKDCGAKSGGRLS